jgi:Winged helix DNA-binding domain
MAAPLVFDTDLVKKAALESIVRRRLNNQRLVGQPFANSTAAIGWLGAVQSQDYGPAKWSLGARSNARSDSAVDDAFTKGKLLRTHVLRPTWHFVLPRDIKWMLELTGPRVLSSIAARHRQLGLDEAVLDRCTELLIKVLSGGNELTRKELRAFFEAEGVGLEDNRLSHILGFAELQGVICSGGLQGKQHTHALLSERAPKVKTLSHDAAVRELVLRYFRSHGPATIKDFRWWSSLRVSDIRQGIEAADLVREEVDGLELWSAGDTDAQLDSPRAHLLQAYDEYIVGYTESRFVMTRPDVDVWNRGLMGVLIVDGRHVGNWKRTIARETVKVEALLHRKLSKREKDAVVQEVDALGAFLGLPCKLELL